MKQKLFLALLTLIISATCFGQNGSKEISIFNKAGVATAYIADDLTIYLWDGDPVTYLSNSNDT